MNFKPDVDIIHDVLIAMLRAKPESVFINSLYDQYCERGGLSKKQLQGLHSKALKVDSVPAHKLATLEAIIKKRPTRYKSEVIVSGPVFVKDEVSGQKIAEILAKYPQHKRLLFLKAKYDNNEKLSDAETSEIVKFHKLLLK